jgi:DNA-binding GntR family transcriptional regulator
VSSSSPSLQDTHALETAAIAGVGRRRAIDAVRARIAMAISLELLKPGERLPDQQEIALGLSVSPMTARRAMASLAEAGIVVRRRGRDGGTFVAEDPPAQELAHFAVINASSAEFDHLEELTREMAAAKNWSQYHQADSRFHLSVAEASHLGTAVESYATVLTELYEHFIPYPIEALHRANRDHIALVQALRRRNVQESVDLARAHVDVLHNTMFMELSKGKPGP